MKLSILLPYKIFARLDQVSRVVAETLDGSFGLLPHRLDCVAALVPGILSYATLVGGERYVAVDEGVMVKSGDEVFVSVRRAMAGTDLHVLQGAVTREYQQLNAREVQMRSVVAKMESSMLGLMTESQRERR
jgi:F-type H+-transporting ATPase subunit epsilon